MFDPKSEAKFEWERWATLRGKRMHVFRYAIAQERSEYSVQYGTSVTVPGYGGLVYIDRETLAVMRITQEVNQMPVGFPINSILAILDYDFIKVADQEFVLAVEGIHDRAYVEAAFQERRGVPELQSIRRRGDDHVRARSASR